MSLQMTAGAARSLKRAAKLARLVSLPRYSPMHLLQAIVLDESRAADFLDTHGVSKSSFPEGFPSILNADDDDGDAIATEFDAGQFAEGDDAISEILVDARRCALRGHVPAGLGSEHLLWGILAIESPAAELLRNSGIETAMLRELCGLQNVETAEPLEVDFDIQWQHADAPPQPATPATPPDAALLRTVDAAANRAREGLRVLEDFVRFQRDDQELTRALKDTRHEVAAAIGGISLKSLLASRDTVGDVGTGLTTAAEASRSSMSDLVAANFKRVQEALRTLEEFGKFLAPELGARFKQLRYRVYSIEKEVVAANAVQRRLADARLYLLVSAEFCELDTRSVIGASLAGGVDVIQVREKSMSDGELLDYLKLVRQITRDANALLIVNDRPDLAVLCDADGVHVGQDELPAAAARCIVGPNRLVGVSTHCIEEARQAVRDGADYLGVGPVYPSTTKHFDEFAGLEYVGDVAREIGLPWFAIGGINSTNVGSVQEAGATRVAVGRDITGDRDPAGAAQRLLAGLSPHSKSTRSTTLRPHDGLPEAKA